LKKAYFAQKDLDFHEMNMKANEMYRTVTIMFVTRVHPIIVHLSTRFTFSIRLWPHLSREQDIAFNVSVRGNATQFSTIHYRWHKSNAKQVS
jgi:hypothetical protein